MFVENEIGNTGVEITARFEDEEIIGQVVLGDTGKGIINVGRIEVKFEYRNIGWGDFLLKRAINWAKQRESNRVTSTLIPEPGSELALRKLFEGNGFEIKGNKAQLNLE